MPLTLITILQTCSGSHLPSFLWLGEPSARTQAGNVFYCFPCAPVMRGSWGHAPTPAQEPQDCLWCPRPTHICPQPSPSRHRTASGAPDPPTPAPHPYLPPTFPQQGGSGSFCPLHPLPSIFRAACRNVFREQNPELSHRQAGAGVDLTVWCELTSAALAGPCDRAA